MFRLGSDWRREALRTNLWLVPMLEVLAALGLYAATHVLDRAVYNGTLTLPSWVIQGDADAARQILTALAAAVITVVGVVFSIMIVTLTLASTQFGPRMLRNFIRDRGTQFTLGTFVATFVYSTLVLISISPGAHGRPNFVPHASITVSVGLVAVSMGVLIYFIHHIASSIQLPQVIASIARDLSRAIDTESGGGGGLEAGPSITELLQRMSDGGGTVGAPSSGYLQFIRHNTLIGIATEKGAVIRLLHRPGHFIVGGQPLAIVWPPDAAPAISQALRRAHIAGPYRTLTQDLAFAVDQLVEIAIRALSPAVNDTFTALTCIDWLGDSLCKITTRWRPTRVHRDSHGYVRVITAHVSYTRLVERAFEKIRQAGKGMPAVLIRQLEALTKIIDTTTLPEQRELLLAQASMILTLSEESIAERSDRADVQREYDEVLAAAGRVESASRDAQPTNR
ncbi:MAG TPA: DUF2254 domain-containing protein [Solirubrobacteraceae bacterium]|jgi:uncharacterized membrane protein|nr:DUF2254 domain-containing protein [Solirubrobacteraceae bacterium]